MKLSISKKKLFASGGILSAIVSVFIFQNCSQGKFSSNISSNQTSNTTTASSGTSGGSRVPATGDNTVTVVTGDSATTGGNMWCQPINGQTCSTLIQQAVTQALAQNQQPVAVEDLVTPRLVLSASLNGPAQANFEPNQTIYGKVYGLGPDNISFCSADWGCNSSGYYSASKAGMTYSAAEKVWRFTLSFPYDIRRPVMIMQSNAYANGPTGSEGSWNISTVVQNTLSVKTNPAAPKFYFADSAKEIRPSNTYKDNETPTVILAGMPSNAIYCEEVAGTNKCANQANWIALSNTTMQNFEQQSWWRYNTGKTTWETAGGYFPARAAGTTVNVFAKNPNNGATAQASVAFIAHEKICMNQPQVTKFSFGPGCADPELGRTCTVEGQTLTGTGACREALICKCQ